MSLVTFSYELANAIGVATLAIAVLFAIFRIDDLIFDAMYWISRSRRRSKARRFTPITVEELRKRPQQRIAIFVPCWHESEVIDRMIDYAMSAIEYENFDIFVGVYPNDLETREKAETAAAKYPNVHAVVNDAPGPTTKAQNLNCIYREMCRVEGERRVDMVVLHDVEDVIHPLSMLLYNAMIPKVQMAQIPVFPLERPWYKFVAWTYADEFSKNHCKDMLLRERLGAFVPSAGVGTAFARAALEQIAESKHDLFPEGALTEDYQFALRLHEFGLRTTFALQRLSPQRKRSAATAAAYIATREYFPDTAAAAIRQKSRWVAGICLQSWQRIGWRGDAATLYLLYRDRRGLVANIGGFFGYVLLVSALAMWLWHWFDPRIFVPTLPNTPAVWLLLEFVLLSTLLELVQGASFTAWIYGPVQGVLSIARAPVAAYINGMATIRALQTFTASLVGGKPMTWSKTAHVFPTMGSLETFTRDVTVLEKEDEGAVTITSG